MPLRPFLLVGACPGLATGTSRIATAIGRVLHTHAEAWGIDLLHVGWHPDALPVHGIPYRAGVPWRVWAYQEGTGEYGMRAAQIGAAAAFGPARGGVVLAVEDPARAFSLLAPARERQSGGAWQRWGYFTVDGENRNGALGGPAAEAVRQFDRALAHTRYGAGILSALRGEAVPWIPHGVDRTVFHPSMTLEERQRADRLLNPMGDGAMVVGCVTTNEARKDLSLVVETLAKLRADGQKVRGWIHIDREIGEAWSLPQLAADAGLDWTALSVTHALDDRTLATLYARCAVTIAPGRGESFGYPILESLACGTPVVHVDYAGGATLLPETWRVEPLAFHPVGPYGILRPIVRPEVMAGAVSLLLNDRQRDWAHYRDWSVRLTDPYRQEDVDERIADWIGEGLHALHAEEAAHA